MPGIVVFKRRWSVGSDDLVVPALFLVILHIIWIIVLAVILVMVEFNKDTVCSANLHDHVLGYLVILSVCVVVEAVIAVVSMQGTIMETSPRSSMQYLLYTRLLILLIELSWLIVGVVWVSQHYQSCEASTAKRAILGIIVCNWVVMLCVLISLWCTFDTAGRSWVKMKRYQESVKERETRPGQKLRSGSRRRNWRSRSPTTIASMEHMTRKALRKYEKSWDRRCNTLFCCVKEDRHNNSFSEVAKIFTEFFRDLDVVPSDIVAGLVLLRKHQKVRRTYVVSQNTNDVYQFLSGVPITPRSQFLSLQNPEVLTEYKQVVYYMRYALAAYGWPMYVMMYPATCLCRMLPDLSCCACCNKQPEATVVEDNCCQCNLAALKKVINVKDIELVYVTYHGDIGETPFYIMVDHNTRKIVISIRGTLSLQDVLTDLKADAEQVPVSPPKEDWLAHKGMVQAANYIRKKIKDEMLLAKAFGKDLERGTQEYDLVCVGHSLGAGTAAILGILLHQEYPNLLCFAYSPPGGLLSSTCAEETKSFITTVIVGKDVVPRIGLNQLEILRQDLINVIGQSSQPKWKLITCGILCCGGDDMEMSHTEYEKFASQRDESKKSCFAHPNDSQIALTSHTPLCLPGKIIHVVRNHPKEKKHCQKSEPVYQAVWAQNEDLDEVLISPTMVNDHMPDNVLEALEKVLTNVSPAKPTRKLQESERKTLLNQAVDLQSSIDDSTDPSFCPHCNCQDMSHIHYSGTPVDGSMIEIEPMITSNITYNLGTEANSMTWDYATMPVNHSRKHPVPESIRSERTKSFPPPIMRLKPGMCVDELGNPEWCGSGLTLVAPLASPETLSEASSMDTMSSKRFSDGYARSVMNRLGPIPSSPQRQSESSRENQFSNIPFTFVDVSPDTVPDEGISLSQDNKDDHMLESIPLAQSTPVKPGTAQYLNDEPSTLIDISNRQLFSQLEESKYGKQFGSDNSLDGKALPTPPPEECVVYFTDLNQTNLTDIEHRIDVKLQDIENNEPYKLTYGDSIVADSDSGEDFALHSPDSTSNQYLYSDHVGHYSSAGRGYPHGSYMSYNHETSESSVDAPGIESFCEESLVTENEHSDLNLEWQSMNLGESKLVSYCEKPQNGDELETDVIPEQYIADVANNVSCDALESVPTNEITASSSDSVACPSTSSSPLSLLSPVEKPVAEFPVLTSPSNSPQHVFIENAKNTEDPTWSQVNCYESPIQNSSGTGSSVNDNVNSPTHSVLSTQSVNNNTGSSSPVVMPRRTISRSSSDESIGDTDCVHQPLLNNKRASYASTSSHSSRRTFTNGQGSDLDDRSSINSFDHKVNLMDEELEQGSKTNGVKVNIADGHHSFGETYFV